MPLQALPTEVVCMIFRFVGAQQLLKNILVCKWWYNIAEPIALEDIVLSADALIKLPKEAHDRLTSYVQSFTLDLYAARDEFAKQSNKNSPGQTITSIEWSEALVDQLENVTELLPRCNRLKSFSLRLKTQFDPSNPLIPRDDYLSLWSPTKLVDVFQATNLLHLVIDTCGSEIKGHICPGIALSIPSLRSVRLRMQRICPRILTFRAAVTQDGHSNTLPLSKAEQQDPIPLAKIESIIINTSLKESDQFSWGYSQHCTESKRGWDLFDDMVTAATEIAKQFPTLKVMRILCHKHPWLEMITYDCISGSKMLISEDVGWDWGDDGCADPDDEEISNQGFSSTDSESSED